MSKKPTARIGLNCGSAAMFLVATEDGQSFVVINADRFAIKKPPA